MNPTQQPIDVEAMEDANVFADSLTPVERDPNGIARYPEASAITGLCPQSIRNRINEKSPYFDESFPKKQLLSKRRNGAVGFIRGSLYAWAATRHEGHSR